jgi:glutaredoxin
MHARFRLIALLALAACAGGALAQYRWIDSQGRVQYTDTPPPPSAKGVQHKNFAPSASAAPKDEMSPALRAAVANFPIKLYTITNCDIGCDEARAYLGARGAPFTEVSVKTKEQLEELKTVSGGDFVPVLRVGRRVHSGFDATTYDSILDGAGYPRAVAK